MIIKLNCYGGANACGPIVKLKKRLSIMFLGAIQLPRMFRQNLLVQYKNGGVENINF